MGDSNRRAVVRPYDDFGMGVRRITTITLSITPHRHGNCHLWS